MKKVNYFFLVITLAVISGRIFGLLMAVDELGSDATVNYSAFLSQLAVKMIAIFILWLLVVGSVWIAKNIKRLSSAFFCPTENLPMCLQNKKEETVHKDENHSVTVEKEKSSEMNSNKPETDHCSATQEICNEIPVEKINSQEGTKHTAAVLICFISIALLIMIFGFFLTHTNGEVIDKNGLSMDQKEVDRFLKQMEEEVRERDEAVKKAAEQGDAEAQYNLGLMYDYGKGVPEDDKEAVKWYTMAANQRHAEAQCRLGCMYEFGDGVPQNYKEAIKWLTKSAEQGYVLAQVGLGNRYAEGQHVPQNYREAVKWRTKAAEQGDAWAQTSLGMMYYEGHGVPQDYDEAVKWYAKAAEQGNAAAQCNLGVMYSRGEGVQKNYVKAYKWNNLAAAQFGGEIAKENRDALREVMSPSQVAEAQRLSKEFRPKTQ